MPEMAVSGYLIERYVRIDAPEDSGFPGFWCEVRQNLSNGDRKRLVEAIDDAIQPAIDEIEASKAENRGYSAELKEGAAPERQTAILKRLSEMSDRMDALAEQMDETRWRLVAPYVRDWNAFEGDPPERIPPPQMGGVDSMNAVTRDMANWIAGEVLQAYRSGKGVLNRSKPPGDSGLPTGGPRQASGTAKSGSTRRSRTSSPGPSASAFQA